MALPVLVPAAIAAFGAAVVAAAATGSSSVDLIFIAAVAIFSSITAPLIISNRTQAHRYKERLEDRAYEKQQEGKRVAAAKLVSDKAEEAARLLLAENERVAEAANQSNGKLDVIHGLVNSQLTAAVQSQLDATRRELVLMVENALLRSRAGMKLDASSEEGIESTKLKITELEERLAQRSINQKRADTAGQ